MKGVHVHIEFKLSVVSCEGEKPGRPEKNPLEKARMMLR